MSNTITDNLALAAIRPALTSAADVKKAGDSGQLFASALEQAIGQGQQPDGTSVDKGRALAESLSLRMLQTTLSLNSDSAAEVFSARKADSTGLQALINSYLANKKETEEAQPQLPQGVSQLQELNAAQPVAERPAVVRQTQDAAWLEPIIAKASGRYGVDGALIKAVIQEESNFNPKAVSSAGARGLMQLMPSTASSLGVKNSFDPEQNVMAGTRFLSDLLKKYDGNLDSALAAYNWGPGNVDRRPDHLPRETRDYLARVKQNYTSFTA